MKSLPREELLQQKQLVEAQLRWLEQKLEALDESEAPCGHIPQAGSPPLIPDHKASAETSALPIEPNFQEESYGLTLLQKIGCGLLIASIAVFALIVLFILPYFIYD